MVQGVVVHRGHCQAGRSNHTVLATQRGCDLGATIIANGSISSTAGGLGQDHPLNPVAVGNPLPPGQETGAAHGLAARVFYLPPDDLSNSRMEPPELDDVQASYHNPFGHNA